MPTFIRGLPLALVDSLLSAIVRLNGDALVLHIGEKPYVVTSSSAMNEFRGPLVWGQVELSTRPLGIEAVSAMLEQLLSVEQRRVLDEMGAVENVVAATQDHPAFSVIAARGGDDIWIEVRPVKSAPVAEIAAEAAPAGAPPESQAAPEEAAPQEIPAAAGAPIEAAQEIPAATEAPIEAPHEVPAAVEGPIEVPAVEDVPVPLATDEPQLEIVHEDEQQQPDEAEVTELLSTAGLLVETPAVSQPGPESFERSIDESLEHPVAVSVEQAVGVSVAQPVAVSVEQPVAIAVEQPVAVAVEQPVAVAVEQPVAVAVEQPVDEAVEEVRQEPVPAVVVPLARTLRDTTGGRSVTPAPTLDRLLKIAAARGASGLYLVAQSTPVVRVEGEMQALGDEEPLTSQEIEAFALHLAPEPAREAGADTAPEWFCELPELGRLRCLRFEDHRGPGLIVRMLPPRAISAEQLGLSREIQALSSQPDGLVLIAGPRSSGKSTLVAAFVDLVNRTRGDHVITIERQISFVHTPRKSLVSQREVRGEAEEIASAVRAALREDPDVLVIEDLRSPEITASALEAAESGRLVLAGLRAPGTVQAVQRLIEQFPPERRRQIESSLGATLRGVVGQVLLRKRGGGRIAARELLLNTPAAATLIGEGKAFQLAAAIESGRRLGSTSLNDTLVGLIRDGLVDSGEAWRRAWDRDGLLTLLKREGIDTSSVERLA